MPAGSGATSSAGGAAQVLPRQLPSTLSDFTGRAAEVADLVQVFHSTGQWPGAVQLAAVTGMGGVGKTALAVHVAHLVSDDFPDGQLYLDLRGYGPGTPLDPLEALSQLIRSLGPDDRTMPAGINEIAGLYRSRLAGQRLLILLDNANSAAQMLCRGPRLGRHHDEPTGADDVAGVRQIALSPLSEADSVDLLATIAGRDRVAAESAGARSIAQLTGRLPLAVRAADALTLSLRRRQRPGRVAAAPRDQLSGHRRPRRGGRAGRGRLATRPCLRQPAA